MSHADFVHLRVRSAFSLLQSTVRVEPLAKACRAAGMPAVAVADDTNLFAVMQFCAAAKKAGVQPIVGAMVALAHAEPIARTPGRPLPPEQLGGRQNSGMPGAGPTQVQPSGHVPPHGGGGGPVKHAQFEIWVPPQQVKVSMRQVVPAGQSPSPQLGYTPPQGVLPTGRQPQPG